MKKSSIYLFLEQQCQLTATHLSLQDNALLSYIDTIAPSEEIERNLFFKEFLNGAYVFIPDQGASYQTFQQIEQTNLINRDRSSSHESLDTQYAFRSNILGECLFGTRELESEKGSWIQLEAYHTNYSQMPAHLITYAWYVIMGENSGPMGTSMYTEATPYILTSPTASEIQSFSMEEAEPILFSDIFGDLQQDVPIELRVDPQTVVVIPEQAPTLLIQQPVIQEQLAPIAIPYEVLS